MSRLSVDIGGTFTDVVLEAAGRYVTTKVLTTYDDPARGVMQGITEVLTEGEQTAAEVTSVLHGTTLATNALIERRGAKTALFTTHGHRDAVEMALENRFEQYDINIDRPKPLVPRALRIPVVERLASDGEVLLGLDETSLVAAIENAQSQGVSSIAVCLLHSYINPQHEEAVAALIHKHAPDISVSLSSRVCPEIREYERASTTVANAYVKPLMAQYLTSLEQQVKDLGVPAQILLMTSGGGLTTLDAAREYPIRLVESGPAGGAMLAAHLASRHGYDQVLSFDMGGTTAKICLIDQGTPLHSRSFEVDRSYRFKKGSGLPVRIPVVEMVEIGAGGGSIANLDSLSRLHVGPESASSDPGPACYGLGGTRPTVTDSDLVLGKLNAQEFAGGKFALEPETARQALQADLGQLAGSAEELGFMVNEMVEEQMASAARAHTSEWGREMASRTMFAFGGAAPLHAAGLAEKLKIDSVLIPADAGVGSAVGFLLAPVKFEVVRSQVCTLADLRADEIQTLLNDMHKEAMQVLSGAAIGSDQVAEEISAYMRYAGQGYEIAVPVDRSLENMEEKFSAAYKRLYGRTIPGMEVEILSWTLALSQIDDGTAATEISLQETKLQSAGEQSYFDGGERLDIPLWRRPNGKFSEPVAGPCIVIEAQTTTVVPEHWQCSALSDGSLFLTKSAATEAHRT